MDKRFLVQLESIEEKVKKLEELMTDPEVLKDQSKIQSIAKEHKELSEILNLYDEYKKVSRQIEEVKQLLNSTPDDDLRELAEEELESLKKQQKDLEKKMEIALLPKDPNDEKNVILEIRQGAGGDEASLFAAELFRMYQRYAERHAGKQKF